MYYSQQRSRPDKPFPVADDFFPQPVLLSAERLEALRAEAASELAKALRECGSYQRARGTYLVNCPPWRAHAELDGLSEYKAPHKTRPNTSVSRVFGTVHGQYRALAQFFRSETRAEYFNVQKTLFNYTIDAAVLHTVPPSSHDADSLAFEGIKWAAYEPFALRFRMDSCHFESSGTGVDATGKPFAFRVLLPVAVPEVPDLFKAKRTVRMDCKSVLLLLPSERSAHATELFMTMRNDFKSNSVPRSFYKRFLQSLHSLHEHVDAKGKDYVLSSSPREWVLAQPHNECGVCARSFSVLRGKRSCDVCGTVVCRRCLVKSSDILQVKPARTDENANSRMCTPCIQLMREDQDHAASTPMLGGDGSARDDIWAKSPTIHEPLRMSETPTETSYGEITGSYLSATRLSASSETSVSSSASHDGAVLYAGHASPTELRARRTSSRFSVASATQPVHRLSTSSSHSSASRRPSMVSLTSPIAVVGAPNEEIEYIDDEDVIYEEDPELLSQRSADGGVILTLDTSEMQRVRNDSLGSALFSSARSTHSNSSGGERSHATSVSSTPSEEVFQSISSSLLEQELLLRQLQKAAARSARRDTRGASVVDVR